MKMNSDRLQKHFLGTYVKLRLCAAFTALAFPLILWIGGYFSPRAALELQPSISAYYHTPLRDLFVGMLFIVGACLFAYQGYTRRENWLLNLAGVLAFCVALVPTGLTCDPGDAACLARAKEVYAIPGLHAAAAISFFACIGTVCIFDSGRTVTLIPDPVKAGRYRNYYRGFGGAMILLPLLALFLSLAVEDGLPPTEQHWAFRVEFLAIWVFAGYWLVKSFELKQTQADLQAALGGLELEPRSDAERATAIRRA